MQHDYEDDASEASGLTAVKLALVGGFAGTVAGLKRRGLSGAIAGGLLTYATPAALFATLAGFGTVGSGVGFYLLRRRRNRER